MDADEMDVDLDAADEIDSPSSSASTPGSGSVSAVLSELAAIHSRASSSSATSPPLSLPSLTYLSSSASAAASFFPRLATAGIPASSVLSPLAASLTAHPLPAVVAYLRLLLAPASPLLTLFSPLPFLSLLLALRKAAAGGGAQGTANPNSGSGDGKRRKRKNQRQPPAAAALPALPSLLPKAISLLADAAGRLPLGAHPDARRSLVDTAVELAAFDVLGPVLGSDYRAEALQDVIRSLAPLVLSATKSPARVAALQFLVRKLVPLGVEEGEEGVRKAVTYLPRYLAVKAPEKTEGRGLAVEAIVEVVRVLGEEEREGFAAYVMALAKGKAKGRLLAVDLVLAMLPMLLSSNEDDTGMEDFWGLKFLQLLIERCSDTVGGVRARALTNAAQALDILSLRGVEVARLQEVMKMGNMALEELLRRRCTDDKAAVRKAALVLTTKAIGLIGRPIDESLLCAMGAACSDPLVSIRKAALAAISEVFRRFPDEKVTKEWLQAVPSLVIDSETSIQEECENLFLELVLNRICQAANLNLDDNSATLEEVFPEGTLDLLKSISDGEVAPCIKKICASLGKKKKLRPVLASSLQNIITLSESLWLRSGKPIEKWTAPTGSWWLLSEVSSFAPKSVSWKFLSHHWKLLDNVGQDERSKACSEGESNSALWAVNRVSLLQTISNVTMELPVDTAADLAQSLLSRIENFDMNLSEVDAHVKTLKTLCKRKSKTAKEGDAIILKWAQQLVRAAGCILDRYIKEASDVRGRSFVTPLSGKHKGMKEASIPKSTSQAVVAVFTVGSLILACPDASVKDITPLLHTIITSANSEPRPEKLVGGTVSFKELAPSLYIQSWDTLAKICLVDDKLAKRYIPIFVQELERSDLATIRNNIMIAMADFYVRYTALVDCYVSKITKSLRDPCEVVRRQTFILLSKLLQRDYVKWRGVLFLRFLPSLVDESEKIRNLADYLFGNILKAKAPLLAYNSFIEAIYVLNSCTGHGAYSESQGSQDRGPALFAIRGTDERSRSKRMHIYVSLLKQMAPEHLLATSAKLCAEILAGACDGLLSVDAAAGRAVLQDALQILACKEMRIHPNICTDNSEMDEEGGEGGAMTSALQAAKGRAVTQVAKKNLIQTAVPIFIELKRLLESKNSPLTGCLMECLRALLKDYKNEIEEILVADKQLQKELLYDMQKYEAGKGKAKATTEAGWSPAGLTPSRRAGAAGPSVEASARATVRSVLKEVNRNTPTAPLHSMSVPKMKSIQGTAGPGSRRPGILESVRRLQPSEFDDEN